MKTARRLWKILIFVVGALLVIEQLMRRVDKEKLLSKIKSVEKIVTEKAKVSRAAPVTKSAKPSPKKSKPQATGIQSGVVNPRAQALLAYVRKQRQFTMADIRSRFPSVTSRTLRRDLAVLESKGYISQMGKTRDSSYQVLVSR